MTKERLNIEYLTKIGFFPFKESESVIVYGKKDEDTYIGVEHHNWNVESTECYADWWILLISAKELKLQCVCNTIEKFNEILTVFKLKRFLQNEKH